MPQARKQGDEHGIRDSIENAQKEEMTKLVGEVWKLVRGYKDVEKPKEFFKFIGERLKSQNIDEAKFANFMIKEAEKSFTRSLRGGVSDFMVMFEAGESTKKLGDKSRGGLGSRLWDSMFNEGLVIVAECIKEANAKKMTVSELSEKTDDELKKLMRSKMDIGKARINEWRDREMKGAVSRMEGRQHAKSIEEQYTEGEELLRKGRFRDANRIFSRVVYNDPRYAKAWLGSAESCLSVADKEGLRIQQLRAAYANRKMPDKIYQQIHEGNMVAEIARGVAQQYYDTVVGLLSKGTDTSKIENPKKAIEECKKKMDLLERTKQD